MHISGSDFLQLASASVVISAVGYGLFRGIYDVFQRKARKREEYFKSFDSVVAQLSSSNTSSQLAAAVLLRRYFDMKQLRKDLSLRAETINVISAMLKVLPVGVFQKTLGDGLAYAMELSGADLQRNNLQDIYLGVKTTAHRIRMRKTDLFMADLSCALLENIDGEEAVFYNAILFEARIKNCDFRNANFAGADLKGAVFKNVRLDGADFTGAINIPPEIVSHLDNGKVSPLGEAITTAGLDGNGSVFFSMPGYVSKRAEVLTKEYKIILEKFGFSVIYYQKDDYPEFGQISRVKESIDKASAVVAFGFRQTEVKSGVQFPGTEKESAFKDRWLHTPWNELEVGMAVMRGLPILLVKDEGVDSGIFDKKLSECFIVSISADFDCRNIDSSDAFLRWRNQIKSRNAKPNVTPPSPTNS